MQRTKKKRAKQKTTQAKVIAMRVQVNLSRCPPRCPPGCPPFLFPSSSSAVSRRLHLTMMPLSKITIALRRTEEMESSDLHNDLAHPLPCLRSSHVMRDLRNISQQGKKPYEDGRRRWAKSRIEYLVKKRRGTEKTGRRMVDQGRTSIIPVSPFLFSAHRLPQNQQTIGSPLCSLVDPTNYCRPDFVPPLWTLLTLHLLFVLHRVRLGPERLLADSQSYYGRPIEETR